MFFILSAFIGYLIGSVNPAYIIGRITKGIDIRNYGSKNAGTMNAFTILGKKAGITTLGYDILKGIIAIVIVGLFSIHGLDLIFSIKSSFYLLIVLLSGFFAILGHDFPFYLKFKGGKGAATTYGIILFCLILLIKEGYFPWYVFMYFAFLSGSFIFITRAANLACFISSPIFIFLINFYAFKKTPYVSLFLSFLLCYIIFVSVLQMIKKEWSEEIKYAPHPSKVKLVRKILRCWAILFPAVYIIFGYLPTLIFIGFWLILFIGAEILRFTKEEFRENGIVQVLLRKREEKKISGITLFTISAFLVVLLFSKTVAITALFFAIFGDLFAELIGKKFGKIKLLGKTFEGTVMCFSTCIIIGLLLKFPYSISSVAVVLGSLATAFIELIPIKIGSLKIDDNFTMPIFSALILSLIL